MPRGYRHIKEYEKEIPKLKGQGMTQREIGERLGFSRRNSSQKERHTGKRQCGNRGRQACRSTV